MRARRLEEKLAAERAINATAVGAERSSASAAVSSLDDDDLVRVAFVARRHLPIGRTF